MIAPLHIEGEGLYVFRPLTGRDESDLATVPGGAADVALWLAERLVDVTVSTAPPLRDLTISAFDDMLEHLLAELVGDDTICRATCSGCGTGFEFGLDLADLRTALRAESGEIEVAEGIAHDVESGRRFRLPRVRDIETLRRSGPEAWMRSLLVEGAYDPALEAEIDRAAPVLSQDIRAACPECEVANIVRFDISDYFVRAVRRDAGFLWSEVHLLARGYHWPLRQILDLPRDVRRRLAGLVVNDSARLRVAS